MTGLPEFSCQNVLDLNNFKLYLWEFFCSAGTCRIAFLLYRMWWGGVFGISYFNFTIGAFTWDRSYEKLLAKLKSVLDRENVLITSLIIPLNGDNPLYKLIQVVVTLETTKSNYNPVYESISILNLRQTCTRFVVLISVKIHVAHVDPTEFKTTGWQFMYV